MIKLVIFDLDGTLLNTVEDLAKSTNHALVMYGLQPHAVSKFYYFLGNGIDKLLERASGQSPRSALFAKVKDAFMTHYATHSMDKTKPYPGVDKLLQELQSAGIGMAILSNKADVFIQELTQRFFSDVRFLYQMGQNARFLPKPDPRALWAIIEECDVPKDQCVYVGDSNVDVQTAQNAGLRSIGAAWGFRGIEELKRAGADAIALQPGEVSNIIKEMYHES